MLCGHTMQNLLFPDEHEDFLTFYVACSQVHDEREIDCVLAIEGIELIGINNCNLITLLTLFPPPTFFLF